MTSVFTDSDFVKKKDVDSLFFWENIRFLRKSNASFPVFVTSLFECTHIQRGGRNRIGRREKWPKKSWEEGEIGGKSREEGEKES